MSKWYVLVFTLFFCCSTFAQTSSIQVQHGWNLLSLPVSVPNNAKDVLFPSAKSKAFIYQSGYQAIDSIINGQGFWLKFDFTETISITGEEIYTDTIEVSAGWNMIGSLTMPISMRSIKTDPPSIIVSDYYSYTNGAYQSVNILQPGSGAWVKVSQDGLIILFSPRPCPGTPTISYAGKIYSTVQIGSQCWLKENLDVGTRIDGVQEQTNNSVIEKYCYNDSIENCNVYGGLYQWNEAMQYTTSFGSKGICPEGWHIPQDDKELYPLMEYLHYDGNSLKAIGQGIGNGAGTDTTGFAALLSGYRNAGGPNYMFIGEETYFWSSTKLYTSSPYSLVLWSDNSYVNSLSRDERNGLSIRCLKNYLPYQPSNPSPVEGAIGQPIDDTLRWSCSDPDGDSLKYDVYFGLDNPPLTIVSLGQEETHYDTLLNSATTYYWKVAAKDNHGNITQGPVWSFTTMGAPCPGTPTVEYAGKTYNTVQIGSQCWLKENLDIGTRIDSTQNQNDNGMIEKYCYNNDTNNCINYGGLYEWNEAMQYTTVPGSQGICPSGWHIPTYAEFQTLSATVDGDGNALKEIGEGTGNGIGTNTSGFSALLSGIRNYYCSYYGLGNYSYIWASTEVGSLNAYLMNLYFDESGISVGLTTINFWGRGLACSVRCLKD